MSKWTHIVAIIDLDTNKTEADIENVIGGLIANAPKITGDERDADVFVNVMSGHNSSEWTPDNTFKKFQTKVAITVIGDLRGRDKDETKSEFDAFVRYLIDDCGFDVMNMSLNIKDDNDDFDVNSVLSITDRSAIEFPKFEVDDSVELYRWERDTDKPDYTIWIALERDDCEDCEQTYSFDVNVWDEDGNERAEDLEFGHIKSYDEAEKKLKEIIEENPEINFLRISDVDKRCN